VLEAACWCVPFGLRKNVFAPNQKECWGDGSPPERVQRAAVLRVAIARFVFEAAHKELFPHALRLVRAHGRAADGRVYKSRALQRTVSEHPARKSETRTPGEEFVVRISRQQCRSDCRTLSIGCAGCDQLEGVFKVPAVLHQVHRKPVE
jgi:hypothetical protein